MALTGIDKAAADIVSAFGIDPKMCPGFHLDMPVDDFAVMTLKMYVNKSKVDAEKIKTVMKQYRLVEMDDGK